MNPASEIRQFPVITKGMRVRKYFKDPTTDEERLYRGEVTKLEFVGKEDRYMYFVLYEDGDGEHLHNDEVLEIAVKKKKNKQKKRKRLRKWKPSSSTDESATSSKTTRREPVVIEIDDSDSETCHSEPAVDAIESKKRPRVVTDESEGRRTACRTGKGVSGNVNSPLHSREHF